MALDIDDILIPANVVAGSTGSVKFDTSIVARAGGIEKRRSRRGTPIEAFTLKFHTGQAAFVRPLYRTQNGKARPFKFDHLFDDVVDNVTLEKITVGGVTTCQLRKAYVTNSFRDNSIVRTSYQPIYRYLAGGLTVTIDASPTTSFTEVDGLLTFGSVISGVIAASITKFYKVVRFDDDTFNSTWTEFDLRSVDSCRVVSLIFP